MKKITKLVLNLIILLTFSINAQNNYEFDNIISANLQKVLDEVVNDPILNGASACIIWPEKGTWTGVSGFSHDNVKINTDMLFGVASVTKTFTAVLTLKLVEEGLLNLDDSLHNWLPSYKNIDSNITIRQLLNMTSGLSDYMNDNWSLFTQSLYTNPTQYWTHDYTLSFVLPQQFSPGNSWHYNSTAYYLLGMIIQKAANTDKISKKLRELILEPLNLNSTFIGIEDSIYGDWAHGWMDYDNDGLIEDTYLISPIGIYSAKWTAAGLVSTSKDLANFIFGVFNKRILTNSIMKEFLTFVKTPASNMEYGLGIERVKILDEVIYGHPGNGHGYNAVTTYFPSRNIGIGVCTNHFGYTNNTYRAWAERISTKLLNVILDYYQYPYDKAHTENISVSSNYIQSFKDSLTIKAKIHNPNKNQILAYATISSIDSTIKDTLELFDDGNNVDSTAGDYIFTNSYGPITKEDIFIIGCKINNLDSNNLHYLDEGIRFTTTGPILIDTFSIVKPNDSLVVITDLKLINMGTMASISLVNAELKAIDSSATRIAQNSKAVFGILDPGESRKTVSSLAFYIKKNTDHIKLKLEISSNNYVYWHDTLSIKLPLVAVEDELLLPTEFSLYQNYPNPFNPSTTIKYELPKDVRRETKNVKLVVYDILGRVVATLVNEKQKPGYFEVVWPVGVGAGNQPSGIYFYQLTAGEFVETKKMILLR